MELARALPIIVAACGTTGPESFIGDPWLANETMTIACSDGTTATTYPVPIAFYTTAAGIAYYDRVVHCTPELAVEGNVATLTAPPAGCSTIIDKQVAPINITEASATSAGSSMHVVITGTAPVTGGTCAISVDTSGVR